MRLPGTGHRGSSSTSPRPARASTSSSRSCATARRRGRQGRPGAACRRRRRGHRGRRRRARRRVSQRLAERIEQKPDQVRKEFERNEQIPEVRSDLRKRKALEWLVEHVEMVDDEGNRSIVPISLPDDRPRSTRRSRSTETEAPTSNRDADDTADIDTGRTTSDRAHPQLPRPDGRRADQPWRAGATTSTRGCSRRTSSSWARRSTTRSPT